MKNSFSQISRPTSENTKESTGLREPRQEHFYENERKWPKMVRIAGMAPLPHQRPGLNKRRSRRLRKKLRIAEFQELGFDYSLTWRSRPSIEEQDAFIDGFVQLIESRDLTLGGGPTTGAVCGVRKNPSSADIEAVHGWLVAWPHIEHVQIGPMVDAWYD